MVMAKLSVVIVYYYYIGANLYLTLCTSTVPAVTCDISRNTTITCHATLEDGQENTICLKAWNVVPRDNIVKQNCGNGSVSVVIELNGYGTWNLQTSVSGETMPLTQLYLREKVVPYPPEIVKLVATGTGRFNLSFKIPRLWDLRRQLTQEINYTQTKISSSYLSQIPEGAIPRNREVVTLSVTVTDIGFSFVCFQMRIRHGDSEINWSDYSNMRCQHTLPLAPSFGPRTLRAVSVRCRDSESRCIRVFWQPPEEEYRNGRISNYSLVLDFTDTTKPKKLDWTFVNGNDTEYTFENVPSDQNFTVRLKAWTDGGPSPEVNYPVTIQVLTTPTETNFVLVGFIFAVFVAACLLLIPLILTMYSKVQANHLPEPHVLNPSKMPTYHTKQPPKEIFDSLNRIRPKNPPDFASQEVASSSKFVMFKTDQRCRSSGDSGVSSAYGKSEEFFDNLLDSNDGVFDAVEENNKNDTCTYTGMPHEDVQMVESTKSKIQDSDVAFRLENKHDCQEGSWNNCPDQPHRYSRPALLRQKVQEEGYVPMTNPHGCLDPVVKLGMNPQENGTSETTDNEVQIYTFMSNNSTSDNVTESCLPKCSSSCDVNNEHSIVT